MYGVRAAVAGCAPAVADVPGSLSGIPLQEPGAGFDRFRLLFEGNYEAALRAYQQVNIDLLGDTERDECALRLGTSYLKMNDLDEAYIWFSVIRAASSKYAADARYNLAYIDYVKQRYDQAWEGFFAVKDQPEYAALAPYYLADIQLIHNNYRQALQLADAYLQAYPQQEFVPQMQRIAGEAHYGLKDYAAAIPLLEAYHDAVDFRHGTPCIAWV